MGRPILNLDDLNLSDLEDAQSDADSETRTETEGSSNAVAIIGLDGRVGSANNLDEFWELLANEREGMRRLPENRRQDLEAFLKAKGVQASIPESRYIRSTFLSDVAAFDPGFFGISQQEANFMDPNQRMFLETAWKALEDAGYGGEEIRGTDTGTFVGFSSDFGEDYRHILNTLSPDAPEVAVAGNVKSIIASRLAYHLDLRGPALLVDTACSSGLLAMYLACRAIRNGECSMALVGAVKSDLLPIFEDGESGVGIKDIKDTFSADGHTRTFDDACDGTTAAEGSFAFVLKSLDQAKRDGDTIRAVILGGAANQDGASNGLTAPNSEAQEDLIIRALEDAGISAEELSYIEAHGTATRLGDPIEISGIQRALRHFTTKKQFCAVGSLKSNIGHLDNAAGLGGVAKLVLAMKHRVLPASLNFNVPNRNIPFVESPVYVNDQTTTWSQKAEEELVAGINSFGLSGTNCHLVLKSAPIEQERSRTEHLGPLLLPLSAKTPEALGLLAAEYKDRLADPSVDLADAVFTASRGRVHHRIRLAVCFETREQLCSALGQFIAQGKEALSDSALRYGEHRIIENENKRRHASDITEMERESLAAEALSLVSHHSGRPSAEIVDRWAELYVAGADLPWDRLTKGLEVRRIPLPTYPFQRTHCWGETKTRHSKSEAQDAHPLLGASMQSTIGHTLFRKNFRPEERWELAEHRVQGTSLLPGTALVEMMVEGVKNLQRNEKNAPIRFTDIMFLQPFTVEDGASKELHMLIEDEDDHKRLRIASHGMDGHWDVHAEAIWQDETGGTTPVKKTIDLQSLKEKLNQPVPMDTKDDLNRGLELGDRWYGSFSGGWMEENAEEILVELQLPQSYLAEVNSYHLHPAMMDMAVNAANNLMDDGELYLPLSYGELLVHMKLPTHVYVHLQKTDGTKGAPIQRFNITLYDPAGNTVVQIHDYCIKSASEAFSRQKKAELYGHQQVFRPLSLPSEEALPQGSVLVAGKHSTTSSALVQTLRNQGRRVLEVLPDGEKWEQALESVAEEDLALAVFTWAPPEHLENEPESWQIETDEAVLQGFHFLKAWSKAKFKTKNGLALLTHRSCTVEKDDSQLHPGQAALSGLWRVGALEFEALNLRCIEHDERTNTETLLNEVANVDRPTFVAYRSGKAYEADIEDRSLPHEVEEKTHDDEGVYLITGGTGDLGTEVARLLARKGVRRIVLLGYHPVPARETWSEILETSEDEQLKQKLERWMKLEKDFEVLDVRSVSIDDYAALSAALSELRANHSRIRGVFHLAGRAGDGFLFQKQEQTFQDVYSPKAKGAINLHLATLQDQPELFIVFSSISSLVLNPGQSDYTAANMFLDTLAEIRHQMGLPALSLQWPAWRETGIAKRMGAVDEEEFFTPVDTDEALALLERVLWTTEPLPPVLMPGRTHKKRNSMTQQPNQLETNEPKDVSKPENVSLLGVLEPDEIDLVVADIWVRTLALEEVDADEEFSDLGGNSLLTSQMLREYEKLYPGVMDIADLFTHTTVREQAEYLKSRIGAPAQAAATASVDTSNKEETKKEQDTDKDIDEILDLVSRGELTVEESSTRISIERRKGR